MTAHAGSIGSCMSSDCGSMGVDKGGILEVLNDLDEISMLIAAKFKSGLGPAVDENNVEISRCRLSLAMR
jgi:hypothetical protein